MYQHTEIVAKPANMKEYATASGFIYAFAVKIESTDHRTGEELVYWLPCRIFSHERRPDILEHKGPVHLTGELRINPPSNGYPEQLMLWSFEATPIGKGFKIVKPARKKETADHAEEGAETGQISTKGKKTTAGQGGARKGRKRGATKYANSADYTDEELEDIPF